MTEAWKPATGTGGKYYVSDLGRVRRADGLILTPSKPRNAREYPCVYLRHSGVRKRVAVHRLVALNFLGLPPFAGAEVRHLDGDHCNPRWDNLAWGSRKDNAADREAHGRTARGDRHGMRGRGLTGAANGNYRVTPEIKAQAIRLCAVGVSQRKVAKQLGISQKAVWSTIRAAIQLAEGR